MAAEKFHMLFLFWALIKGMSEAKADVGVWSSLAHCMTSSDSIQNSEASVVKWVQRKRWLASKAVVKVSGRILQTGSIRYRPEFCVYKVFGFVEMI